jgi:hypothetical protein
LRHGLTSRKKVLQVVCFDHLTIDWRYLLLGVARQAQGAAPTKDPRLIKEGFYIGPHVMVVLPNSAKDALRGQSGHVH